MGRADDPPEGPFSPDDVRGLFDRAVALFNAHRFFEAHEDWESLWHEAEGARREWLQGLIQFAAAFHHFERGGASGFSKLTASAGRKALGYGGETHGIDFARLATDLAPWVRHGERVAAGTPLREGAPAAFPTIRRLAGVVAAPWPLASEDADGASEGGSDGANDATTRPCAHAEGEGSREGGGGDGERVAEANDGRGA